MTWKVVLGFVAVAGGIATGRAVLAARQRARRATAAGSGWAEATDPVPRFGGA
jgi:hypothetical protein